MHDDPEMWFEAENDCSTRHPGRVLQAADVPTGIYRTGKAGDLVAEYPH